MKQVLIIGAGPAGLTAAYELLKRGGYAVTVLEESEEIGGISRTVRYNGNRMDIGGHRFFSKDQQVMRFWEELMPLQGALSYDDKKLGRTRALAKDGPDPEQEDRVMLLRGRVSRIYYNKKFFDYPISMKPQTFQNMGLSKTMQAGCSYMASVCRKLPETSLENFYVNRFGRVLYSMFFEGYTEKLWGRHPREISADWGAQRVKGLSIRTLIKDMVGKVFGTKQKAGAKVETSLIEEFRYPKFGPGQLWEECAAQIEQMGGRILKNHCVKTLRLEHGKIVSVTCSTPDGEQTFTAEEVISTMPVKDLIAGMRGDVPQEARRIAAGLPYRDFVTVGLLVNKLHLKNETDIATLGNIVPDCWIYVQDTGVKLGRIQIFNNWSPYLVKDPEHTVWIGLEYFCNEGDDFWNMTDEQCVAFAKKELCSMGVIEEADVLDSHREKVKKAYPAYFDTYAEMDKLVEFLDGIGNLYCIGRNGQHRYNNMDHSMATAMRAVECIAGEGAQKADIWKVNTEQEYHEVTQTEQK